MGIEGHGVPPVAARGPGLPVVRFSLLPHRSGCSPCVQRSVVRGVRWCLPYAMVYVPGPPSPLSEGPLRSPRPSSSTAGPPCPPIPRCGSRSRRSGPVPCAGRRRAGGVPWCGPLRQDPTVPNACCFSRSDPRTLIDTEPINGKYGHHCGPRTTMLRFSTLPT